MNKEILIKEQIKYKKIEDSAKILIKQANVIKIKLKHHVLTKAEREYYEGRIKVIRTERDLILDELKIQKNLINVIERQQIEVCTDRLELCADPLELYESIIEIYMNENIVLRQEIEALKKRT